MLLLHILWSALLSMHLVPLALLDEVSSEFVCLDQTCYSISWDEYRYSRAKKSCKVKKGQLQTVKNSVQGEAITMLMDRAPKEDAKVWIGLELPPRTKCTDLQQRLRGFTWVTGDNRTDYTNWEKDEHRCDGSPLCVTVRKDGKWEETSCDHKADGFLCEISYSSPCSPPFILPSSYNVSYYHPTLGMGPPGGYILPPGTNAIITTSLNITKLVCEAKGDGTGGWKSKTPGAWDCGVEKGGCEHECVMNDTAKCKCPTGSELKADLKSCTNLCDPNPCSQLCFQTPDPPGFICMCSEGYNLSADNKTCEDIDDCAANPNICENHCTNTIGGFECGCKPGFEMVEATCNSGETCGSECKDIDECMNPKTLCEHECDNFDGGFRCVCFEGFIVDDKNPNKCKRFCNTSSCEADCDINNNDSCQCPDGYIVDQNDDGDNICADVDECESLTCDGSCINTFGSFICTCPEGYTVQDTKCIPPPDASEPPEGSGSTEPPTAVPSPTSSPTSRPPDIHSLQPAMLLGICIGIISMLTVLLAILCHMLRKHYIEEHALDYKCKNAEKDIVLQQVTTEPQHKLQSPQ